MSREAALAKQQRGLGDWAQLLGASSPGATVLRRGGITAALVPACPQRSLCNSVVYTDTAELVAALAEGELDRAYAEAGIAAWTVWAPEFDREAIAALEAAGHALDGSPLAMSAELDALDPSPPGDLDWDTDADPADLGRINDLAYGLPADAGVAPSLAAPPPNPNVRLYQARVDGEPATVLATIDHDTDLGFYFVATDPDHRGLGLAGRLIGVAIAEARERGLETSSLQGSPMGRSLYRRLGFHDDYAQNLWELRR